jgi:hypothetical protein
MDLAGHSFELNSETEKATGLKPENLKMKQ